MKALKSKQAFFSLKHGTGRVNPSTKSKQAIFHVSKFEIKNIDWLQLQYFYTTFVLDRDECESREKDATSEGTAKCDIVASNL